MTHPPDEGKHSARGGTRTAFPLPHTLDSPGHAESGPIRSPKCGQSTHSQIAQFKASQPPAAPKK